MILKRFQLFSSTVLSFKNESLFCIYLLFSDLNPQQPSADRSNDGQSTKPDDQPEPRLQPEPEPQAELQPQPQPQPHQQEFPNIDSLDKPTQPQLEVFPLRVFGKDRHGKEIKRSFNSSW